MTEKELEKLQKEANRYLIAAREGIKNNTVDNYTTRAYYNAINRMHMFQKKLNIRKGSLFSMKQIFKSDYDVYEQILRSVTENKRLNIAELEKYKQSQIDFYISKGWASNEATAEALFNFKGTGVFETLMEKNLSDIPSEILERFGKFVDAGYSVEDFGNMLSVYMLDPTTRHEDFKDFISYTDSYIKIMRGNLNFQKLVETYIEENAFLDITQRESFFEFERRF